MRKTLALTLAAIVAAAVPAVAGTQLTGAGSTWDYPFFSKAFYEYGKSHDVQVNYQSIGSGGGIAQFTQRTVDFGATDVPMNATEIKTAQAGGGPVLQAPVVLGGVSIIYNLPGVTKLRFTSGVLAKIFLGTIKTWNDPAIVKLNPGQKIPNTPIVVVHRSDGSGTTYTFTDYLSHVSPEWKSKVGAGKSVSWPSAGNVGGKGSEGLSGQVTQAPGAIGYVELAYALQNKIPQASLMNKAGKWVDDGPDTVKAAAASRPEVTATEFRSSTRRAPRAGRSRATAGWSFIRTSPTKPRARRSSRSSNGSPARTRRRSPGPSTTFRFRKTSRRSRRRPSG